MKKPWKAVLAVVVLSMVMVGVVRYFLPSEGLEMATAQVRPASDFDLEDSHGAKHRLEDYRGKWVILHFWAGWCPPCLDEIPNWVELGNLLKDQPVQLIAVSLDSNWNDAHKILPEEKLTSNILSLLDQSGKLAETYGSFQFPETYFISPERKIVTKRVGPQEWTSPAMMEWIQNLIKNSKS